ncbi:MAG: FtsK/SpoIIIE domain-containing protein [Muribaculaceae bacterium]|nr:FtsK/SpoIIIE domain-containing protein [Muribaculaceae bacterium]MCM1441638.1 FtsK/SpoIIIE domain-containing protein [Roseburia sp.]
MQEGNAYTIPDTSLLDSAKQCETIATREARVQAAVLESYLADKGIPGQIVEISPYVSATRYTFKPDNGMSPGLDTTIKNFACEVAPGVGCASVSDTAPDRVSIYVHNKTRYTARMGDIVSWDDFQNTGVRIPWGTGYVADRPQIHDLADIGATLVLGEAGADIQTFLQTLIISILYRFTPHQCRLTLINAAHADLGLWADIPHLATPLVRGAKYAATALDTILNELDQRQASLNATSCQNMPYIVVIIDELEPLMTGVCRTQVENSLCRIAQQGPAVGIYPVVATRRVDIPMRNVLRQPTGDILTAKILDPFKSRFFIQAQTEVRFSERWVDTIFPWGNKLSPLFTQMPHIEPSEVARVADFVRNHPQKERSKND